MRAAQEVRERYLVVNGDHPMTAADDAYCRRFFATVPHGGAYSAARLLELMAEGEVPLPSYYLSDGTAMVHPDYLDVIRGAGGHELLREWFVTHWEADEQHEADDEWEGYLSGQYVCLYSVTPQTIQAKTRLIETIKRAAAALDSGAGGSVQAELAEAVDALDDLEPPFTGYDRLRFGGALSREVWIDQIRADYLAPRPGDDAGEGRTQASRHWAHLPAM